MSLSRGDLGWYVVSDCGIFVLFCFKHSKRVQKKSCVLGDNSFMKFQSSDVSYSTKNL